jgi:hypothetical protein
MTDISIGDAVGAGFGVIRHRPLTVLLWGALMMVMAGIGVLVMAPAYSDLFARFAQRAASGHAAPMDTTNIRQMQGVSYLLSFLQIFVLTVLNCAIFRSVVHPERSAFAYLRVGGTELILFALVIAQYFAFIIAAVVVVLPGALVMGILVALHAGGFAAVVGALIAIAAAGAGIYVALRFSMMGPMMVDDDQVHFADAWALTKGKVGNLFLIGLCLFAILIVAELVIVLIGMVVGFGALSGLAGGVRAIPVLFKQPPSVVLSRLTPLIILAAVIAIPLYGAVLTVFGAPWARAYMALRRDPAEAF